MKIPPKPFYFVRHGETVLNTKNLITGAIDDPLTGRGISQAHQAATDLESIHFCTIVSSPRLRALETAKIISLKNKQPLIIKDELSERSWGNLEGKTLDITVNWFDDANIVQGGETATAFVKRIFRAVSSLLQQYECPLLVSHGGVFMAIAHLMRKPQLRPLNGAPYHFIPHKTKNNDGEGEWKINKI